MSKDAITIQSSVKAPLAKVWQCWVDPNHITKWAFATDTWEAPYAENDIKTGGKFKTVMSAKDKSASFDFSGVYSNVKEFELIEYSLEDGRQVKTVFSQGQNGVNVVQTFDPESENSEELQRSGWQSILDNFKKHVENCK